ncbi:hypothetical protein PG989_004773 [Apiospora arundinis]
MPDVPDPSDGYMPPPPSNGAEPYEAELPTGSQVVRISPHGSSFWTQTAQIETITTDGATRSYFLKIAEGEEGRGIMSGEFESMSLLFRIIPDLVPKPVTWGTYRDMPQFHFFLCDFQNCPPIEDFTASIARLHKASIPLSPGKFGFPVTTYQGPIAQDNSWCDTWEAFFRQGMVRMLQREEDVHGPDPELSVLCEQLYDKVIPRLLRPLTVLKSITPVLVHGDLWYGNVCTDNATGKLIVFDACVFWAHNEYEVGTWRAPRYRFGKSYIEAYQKHFAIAEPTKDHDDRNALYSMSVTSTKSPYSIPLTKFAVAMTCIHLLLTGHRYASGESMFDPIRKYESRLISVCSAMDTMKYLIDKFPRGYEEWEKNYEISHQEAESGIGSADVALS